MIVLARAHAQKYMFNLMNDGNFADYFEIELKPASLSFLIHRHANTWGNRGIDDTRRLWPTHNKNRTNFSHWRSFLFEQTIPEKLFGH